MAFGAIVAGPAAADTTGSTEVLTVGVGGLGGSGFCVVVGMSLQDSTNVADPTIADSVNGDVGWEEALRITSASGITELVVWFRPDTTLAQSDTITVSGLTDGQSRAIKAFSIEEVDTSSPTTGTPTGNSPGSSTTPNSGNITTTIADAIIIGAISIAGPTTDGFTQDSDYSSTVPVTGVDDGGTPSASRQVRFGDRLITATETNNYAPTLGTSRTLAVGILAFRKQAVGGVLEVFSPTHAFSVDAPGISQVHSLTTVGATHSFTVEAPTISQNAAGAVSPESPTFAVTLTAAALSQVSNFTVVSPTFGHTVAAPSLGSSVTAVSPVFGFAASGPSLTQTFTLNIASPTFSFDSDAAPTSTSAGTITVVGSVYGFESESATITTFSLGLTPDERVYLIQSETRVVLVANEVRTYTIAV